MQERTPQKTVIFDYRTLFNTEGVFYAGAERLLRALSKDSRYGIEVITPSNAPSMSNIQTALHELIIRLSILENETKYAAHLMETYKKNFAFFSYYEGSTFKQEEPMVTDLRRQASQSSDRWSINIHRMSFFSGIGSEDPQVFMKRQYSRIQYSLCVTLEQKQRDSKDLRLKNNLHGWALYLGVGGSLLGAFLTLMITFSICSLPMMGIITGAVVLFFVLLAIACLAHAKNVSGRRSPDAPKCEYSYSDLDRFASMTP